MSVGYIRSAAGMALGSAISQIPMKGKIGYVSLHDGGEGCIFGTVDYSPNYGDRPEGEEDWFRCRTLIRPDGNLDWILNNK